GGLQARIASRSARGCRPPRQSRRPGRDRWCDGAPARRRGLSVGVRLEGRVARASVHLARHGAGGLRRLSAGGRRSPIGPRRATTLMRIGIDARELGGRATGVGRFLRGLLREWSNSSIAGAHEFVLYAPGPLAIPLDSRQFRIREVAGTAGTWWEQMRLPDAVARDGLDVLFAPAYTAPLRVKVPIVAAIYDLSYVAHPEWFRLREGIRRRWLTQKT